VKALSVWQPWAALQVVGVRLPEGGDIDRKDVENRYWGTPYRGPLLIHASRTAEKEGAYLAGRILQVSEEYLAWYFRDRMYQARGALLGVVNLVRCTKQQGSKWHMPGMHGWYTADAYAFAEPIPYRGERGLFDVPDDKLYEVIGKREDGHGHEYYYLKTADGLGVPLYGIKKGIHHRVTEGTEVGEGQCSAVKS
jgi:uncharacterized protein (DUF3820 family)